MPVTGATMENEIILEAGTEGGLLILLGRQGTRGGWRFRTVTDEGTLLDLLNEEDLVDFEPRHETAWIISWEAALTLLDAHPWHLFCPLRVHPDFTERVWTAVQVRFAANERHKDDWAPHNIEHWRRLCNADGPAVPSCNRLLDDLRAIIPPEKRRYRAAKQRKPISLSQLPSSAASKPVAELPPRSGPSVIPALILVMLVGKFVSAAAEPPETAKHRHHHVSAGVTTEEPADGTCKPMPADVAAGARELLREHRDQRYGVLSDLVWKGWCIPDDL